jgi:cold shock CspA family protein
MEGRVLWFKKTYGFVASDDNDEEIFFHWSAIRSDQQYIQVFSGDRVKFDIVEDLSAGNVKRMRAINLELQPRVSDLGKTLLRLSFIDRDENLSLSFAECYITAKAANGLKYMNIIKDKIIATDKKLNQKELIELFNIINVHKITKKTFFTDNFKYDLNLV